MELALVIVSGSALGGILAVYLYTLGKLSVSDRLTEAEWLLNNARHERGFQSEEWWVRYEKWRQQ